MYKKTIPYSLSRNAFSAYSGRTQSMQFSSLAATPNGNELLFLNASECITAWLATDQTNTLKLADGTTTTLAQLTHAALQFQTHSKGILAGYFSYEVTHLLETLPPLLATSTTLPDVFIGHYDTWLEINHKEKTALLIAPSKTEAQRHEQLINKYNPLNFKCLNPFVKSESKDSYIDNIDHILNYIHAGDCYQINYAQHFSAAYSGSSYAAFSAIAKSITAPYAGYVNTGHGELLSFSPEQFIQVDAHRNIRSRPIKGTARRSATPREDEAIATALLASEKNRAENVMIVDLLRHDLGKSCTLGSIKVDKLFALETFTNVHHLVSTISGRLKESCSPLAAMLAAYPGGSITGAPKIRAMEIINELESRARSAYCGSMFYQKPDGCFDSNIMIRTLVASENTLHCWGGGGIVADSDPEQEHQETLDKVELYMQIIEKMQGLGSAEPNPQ